MQKGYTELNTYRYERKFVAHKYSRLGAEAVIKQNNAFFVPVFRPRRVNNIYFDTPGLDCYFDNLFGNGNRWKARIRWYGNAFGNVVLPILEFKIKKGFAGTKQSFSLPGFKINREIFEAHILKEVFQNARLPESIHAKLSGLQPVLLNTYHRSYYRSMDRKFRVTIDDQLLYYNLRPSWNRFQFKFSEQLKTVIELKYDEDLDSEAEKITSQFPFRMNKNSKFVAGMGHFRSEIAE
jgi:SPX domain protein involved in polyphosphate accumulation